MNPGSTVLPARSITFTPGPINVSTSSLLPRPTKRPLLMAKAWTRGWLGSMVMILAFLMTVSALVSALFSALFIEAGKMSPTVDI